MLRKMLDVGGLSDVDVSNALSLVTNLDPERVDPYGPWRMCGGGLADASVLAQTFGAGLLNPAGSGGVCIIEEIIFTCSVTATWTYTRNTLPQALHAALAGTISIDDDDSSAPRSPIKIIRDNAAALGGQVLGAEGVLAQMPNAYRFGGMVLFPGQETGFSGTPGVASSINWSVRARWISPVP